ncbi:DUF5033 domain-containing protein [Bacteroides sp.]
MKTIYSLIVIALVFGFTSCTTADNDVTEPTSLFESVKSTYGVEDASYSVAGANDVPSVSTEDMRGVLEALRQNSNTQKNCIRTSEDGFEKVIMTGSYQASTRSGDNEDFALKVELKFTFEKTSVYYWGTDYSFSSNLFDWRAQGSSLAPVKGADGHTYGFESESYLYFKIKDEGNALVKVPVIFKGDYNFSTQEGTYSFQLLKYSK